MRAGTFDVAEMRFAPGLTLARHVHDTPIIAIVLEGSMDVSLGGRSLRCTGGTVQAHPAGEPHAQTYGDAGATILVIEPEARSVADALSPFQPMLAEVCHFRHAGVERLARVARAELRRGDSLTPLALEALALQMLVAGTRSHGFERLQGATPDWLRRAHDLVRDRFRDRLELSEIAAEVGIHPGHLARAFRERFDTTVGEYARNLRVDWAVRRLTESRDSLSTISFEAGFSDQSHLTRAVKRHTGLTPARYREARR